MFNKKQITWEQIFSSYTNNPRDVKTVPFHRDGIWFYVYVENDNVYVKNARNHTDSSNIKIRRKIEKEKLDAMLSLYHRRKKVNLFRRKQKKSQSIRFTGTAYLLIWVRKN